VGYNIPSTSTLTGGITLQGGFIRAGGGVGSFSKGIKNAIVLGSKIDGTPDEI
jgi:hypothetical protein